MRMVGKLLPTRRVKVLVLLTVIFVFGVKFHHHRDAAVSEAFSCFLIPPLSLSLSLSLFLYLSLSGRQLPALIQWKDFRCFAASFAKFRLFVLPLLFRSTTKLMDGTEKALFSVGQKFVLKPRFL